MLGVNATVARSEDRRWAPDPERKPAPDVREMFARVSRRYDLLNRLISLGQDERWRRRAAALADLRGDERVLDVATGTADLALAFASRLPRGLVVAVDFCRPMLELASAKIGRRAPGAAPVSFAAADALRLPFRDASFDVCTAGFGVRNFESLAAGLAEMCRVLRPGGRVVVLESSSPETPARRLLTGMYMRIVPAVGRTLSRSGTDAYRYLAESMRRFPDRASFERLLVSCGFESPRSFPLTLGIVTVTVARKPATADERAVQPR
jgi:demethylmenaquinone methyltransferase / 2-methoxy-6-polyprenyl-1,4-benzoquinol methylase